MNASTSSTARQASGSTPADIKIDSRITVTSIDSETGLIITSVRVNEDGSAYVSGKALDSRGRPLARSGQGLTVSGPAGGSWDWYANRKPSRPGRPITRRRVVKAEGDGKAVYRNADLYDASAAVYVATEPGRPAELFADPGVILNVTGAGSWSVATTHGWSATPVIRASGSVDDPAPGELSPRARILAAVADHGGDVTGEQLRDALECDPEAADVAALRDAGQLLEVDEPGVDGVYRRLTRITYAGRRQLARATNMAAKLIPADAEDVGPSEPDSDGADTYPSLMVGGAQAFMYVNRDGALCLSLHLDTGEVPAWLEQNGGERIPLVVTVNGDEVFSDVTGAPMAGPHRFTQHASVSGSCCPWSLEEATNEEEHCPDGCAGSGIERDPSSDTDS